MRIHLIWFYRHKTIVQIKQFKKRINLLNAYSAFIKNSPIENIRTPLGFYSSVRANEKRIKNNIPPIKYRRKYRVNYICI